MYHGEEGVRVRGWCAIVSRCYGALCSPCFGWTHSSQEVGYSDSSTYSTRRERSSPLAPSHSRLAMACALRPAGATWRGERCIIRGVVYCRARPVLPLLVALRLLLVILKLTRVLLMGMYSCNNPTDKISTGSRKNTTKYSYTSPAPDPNAPLPFYQSYPGTLNV